MAQSWSEHRPLFTDVTLLSLNGAIPRLALNHVQKRTPCKAALMRVTAEHHGKARYTGLAVVIKSVSAGTYLLRGLLKPCVKPSVIGAFLVLVLKDEGEIILRQIQNGISSPRAGELLRTRPESRPAQVEVDESAHRGLIRHRIVLVGNGREEIIEV